MNFFKRLAQVAAPVIITVAMPGATVNTALGAVLKHATRLNNQAIPYVNLAASTLWSYGHHVAAGEGWGRSVMPALQEGGLLMAASTALHQAIKVPTQGTVRVGGQSL